MTTKKADTPPADNPAAENPPADNNKRLAFLESSSAAIAAVLVAGNLMPDDDTVDPLATAEVELGRLAKVDAELAAARGELEQANAGIDLAYKQAGEDHAKIEQLEAKLAEAEEAKGNSAEADTIAGLEDQVRSLTEDLAAANGKIAKFDKAAAGKHTKGQRQVKARQVGPIEGGNNPELLTDAMANGGEFELVFSNGNKEIIEFEPVKVLPQAFLRKGAGRFELIDPLLVQGAGIEQRVRGVGLLSDGEQIAYTAFPTTVRVPVGQQVKFDRMISFQ